MSNAGRPRKEGLDFAGWDVHVLENDTKIDQLIDAQGIAAFTVYFYLCQRAYATHGYYLEWSYSLCPTVARKLGKGACSEFVKNVVDICFQCCLFDKSLFEVHGILTSRGLQKRYWAAISDRASRFEQKKFWLLEPEECQGFVSCAQNSETSPVKSNFTSGNSNFQQGNTHIKKRKEKETKDIKDTGVSFSPEPENSASEEQAVITLLLNDETEYAVPQKDFESWVELYRTVDVMRELRKMKGWLQANPGRRKTRRGINRFISGWLSREQDHGGVRTVQVQASRVERPGQNQGDPVLAALREMYAEAGNEDPPTNAGGYRQ